MDGQDVGLYIIYSFAEVIGRAIPSFNISHCHSSTTSLVVDKDDLMQFKN